MWKAVVLVTVVVVCGGFVYVVVVCGGFVDVVVVFDGLVGRSKMTLKIRISYVDGPLLIQLKEV